MMTSQSVVNLTCKVEKKKLQSKSNKFFYSFQLMTKLVQFKIKCNLK